MCSPLSTSQLPNGTSALTHSTLRTPHDSLVGPSIQDVYEMAAQDSSTANGAAISRRRRRRLRLAAGPPGWPAGAAPGPGDAGTGGEPAASGGALTAEPKPDLRRRITSEPRSGRARQRK